MAKILFLTDSAADIPKSLREELGIRVMPFPIAMGERELRDGEDFTPQEFYQALAEEPKSRHMPSSRRTSSSSAMRRPGKQGTQT